MRKVASDFGLGSGFPQYSRFFNINNWLETIFCNKVIRWGKRRKKCWQNVGFQNFKFQILKNREVPPLGRAVQFNAQWLLAVSHLLTRPGFRLLLGKCLCLWVSLWFYTGIYVLGNPFESPLGPYRSGLAWSLYKRAALRRIVYGTLATERLLRTSREEKGISSRFRVSISLSFWKRCNPPPPPPPPILPSFGFNNYWRISIYLKQAR